MGSSALVDGVLVKLDVARTALAAAKTIQDTKKIANVAAVAEVYARQQKLGQEAIDYAHSIKIEALRRLGELLKVTPKAKGSLKRGPVVPKRNRGDAPTLADYGLDKKTSSLAQKIADLPAKQFEEVRGGTATVSKAIREARTEGRERAQEEAIKQAEMVPVDDRLDVRTCDMSSLLASVRGVNAIITDPPYGKDAVPLYAALAEAAKSALAPDGVLVVMCGQSYLDQILPAMAAHLPYRWTVAYLTPGGQSPQIWPRKVNSFWKPVLVFGGAKEWIGDVVKSDVNDNDKRFHHWGQSESGMRRLVEMFTAPGELVCDPFLGGGTTGVVSLSLGRRFLGADVDGEMVERARKRMAA